MAEYLSEIRRAQKQEAYWIQQFSDDIPVLNLPYDYKRPVMQNFEGNERRFTFDEEQTEALRKIANETGSTMHMVLLSAFYILLSKYSGQEDIVIGTLWQEDRMPNCKILLACSSIRSPSGMK